jgi:AsmA-like protein
MLILQRMRPSTVALVVLAGLAILGIVFASTLPFSSETARRRVIELLAARLDGEVELETLTVRILPRLRAEGHGLVVRYKGRRDVPPLITVRDMSAEGSVMALLLRKHVSTVTLQGLDIQIPPRDNDEEGLAGPLKGKSGYVIDELVTSDARLTIIPREADKDPRVWAIHRLRVRGVAFDRAMPYEATITNAIPPGEIETSGSIGPWQGEEPGLTPLEGSFTFEQADLSVFRGISGMLSARGRFNGRLDRVEVDGETVTPEFAIASVGHTLPLRAKYHTVVDGTNGDTVLEHVDATLRDTPLVAKGAVIDDTPGRPGRRVKLDVTIEAGRLDDLLWLAVKAPRPPMTGTIALTTSLEIPPGPGNVVEKLLLDGKFSMTNTRFTNPEVQKRIEELSRRGRGQPTLVNAGSVTSDFTGSFKLNHGVLRIPAVAFDVPGSAVRLSGTYNLNSEAIDFTGTLFMDAKISETVTGFKRLLLKVVDPLFRGSHGGSALPIRITGRRDQPSFGLDRSRIFKRG